MNNLAGPANTNPILPAIRVAGLPASGRRCTLILRGPFRAARNPADAQEARSKIPVFVLLYMLQSHRRLPARQFLPHQTPHFNANIFTRFTHFAHLFQRNFTPFCKSPAPFCKFSHFETLSHTPHPPFQLNIKGDPAPVNFPTPISPPKIRWLFAPNPANKCALSDYAAS